MSFFSIDWSDSAKNQTSSKHSAPIVPQIRIEQRASRKKSSLRSKFVIDQKHRNQSEIYQGNLLKFVKEYSAVDGNQDSDHDAEQVA